MAGLILKELKNHAPFTVFGAVTGIIIMVLSRNMPVEISYKIFYILHPAHVFLSALVTASLYKIHRVKHKKAGQSKIKSFIKIFLVGYAGAIGIATLSDSLIPYLGETLLDMPERKAHIGFIEKWWLINPLAIAGVLAAYFRPGTKFPHAGHVLLSTWASLFHILMASGEAGAVYYAVIFLFLFISVWVPCCLSDIIFPLLFVKEKGEKAE